VGLAPDDTYIEAEVAYEIGKAEEAVLGDEEILGETDSATAPTPVEINEPLGLVLGEQTSAGVEMIEGNNLLRNSSFEEQEDGAPKQWTYQHTSNLGNSFVDAVYRSGVKSLHLKSNTANSNGNFGVSQPDIKLKGGRAYTFSAYVKPIGVSNVTVRLTFWDSVGNKRAKTKDFNFSGDKEWTRVSLSIDNYNTYVGDQYFPMIEVMGLNAGSLYIDDAQLQEGTVLGLYAYGNGSAAALYNGGGSAIGDGSVLVSNGGLIYPAVDGTGSLGSSNNKFEELHLSNASIDKDGGLTVGGVVTQGTITTDTLYVSSGALGIGTTTALTALHVVGTTTYENTGPTDRGCIRYNGASMQYSNNCTAFSDFSASAAGGWTTATTRVWNTDLLTDIGIGLSDPAAKLEIQVGSTEAVTAVLIDQNDIDQISLDIDAAASSVTTGVIDIDIGASNAAVDGINLSFTVDDGATATTDFEAMVITLTANDANADVFGLVINAAATANATTATYESGLFINNTENTAASMTDGILITSSGVDEGITDAIDVSASNILNALTFGDNAIDGTYFDILETTGAVVLTQQAAGTSPLTITGKEVGTTPLIDIGSSNVSGNIVEIDWSGATTQTGAMAGAYINMTNLTTDGTNAAYGLHVNDIGTTSNSTEYGIYQQGTNSDIGIMAEGGIAFGTQQTLEAGNTMPGVAGGTHWTTADTTTIWSFASGVPGQLLIIEGGAATVFDCTGSAALNCGGGNITIADGDTITFMANDDATVWNLINWYDVGDTQSGGDDVAEYMKSDQNLEAGTVVVAHPSKAEYVVRSEYGYDSRVIGIVADKDGVLGDLTPGLLMGDEEDGTPVTLAGRVWAKFDDQNGDASPGDALTSAPNGKLMKAVEAGPMVGKAMSTNVDGYVITLLNMGWYNPSEVALGDLIALPDDLDELALLAGVTSDEVTEETEVLAALGGDDSDESEVVEGDVLGATDELEVLKEKTLNVLTVTDSAVFEGTVTVASLDVSGMVIVAGDVRVGGDLQVAGAVVSEFTAGQALSTGDAVAVSGANTVVRAYSTSNMPAIGVVVGGAGAGSTVKVAISGKVSGYGGLAVGSRYYVGSAGVVQAGAPEEGKKQVIGVAVSASTLLVMPSLTYDEAGEVVEPVVEEPAPPVVEEPAPPVDEEPAPSVDEEPAPPVVEEPAPPVDDDTTGDDTTIGDDSVDDDDL